MNVFELRDRLIEDYGTYVRSFMSIRDERIAGLVDRELDTTEQIRRAADRLLGTADDDLDGGVEDRRSRSLLRGPKPPRGFTSPHQEAAFAVGKVRSWLDAGLRPEDVGVVARTDKLVEPIARALADAGLGTHRLKDDGDASRRNSTGDLAPGPGPGVQSGAGHLLLGGRHPESPNSFGLRVSWVGRPSPLLETELQRC